MKWKIFRIYWVPQNSRNNSVGQCQHCQFTLENYEKNNKNILCLSDLKIWQLKRSSFDLVYLKYILKKILFICFLLKKDFDYLFFTKYLANAIIILNHCDQVCNYLLHYFQLFKDVILCRFCFK
jgi:hypothetical protein